MRNEKNSKVNRITVSHRKKMVLISKKGAAGGKVSNKTVAARMPDL